MPLQSPSSSPRQAAHRVNGPPPASSHEIPGSGTGRRDDQAPEQGEQHKGFISSHFGSPEQVHVFGAGNDYESEEEVKEEEKAAAGQFIWYFGALVVFLLVCYLLFGYRR
jgi:hypothetical protein